MRKKEQKTVNETRKREAGPFFCWQKSKIRSYYFAFGVIEAKNAQIGPVRPLTRRTPAWDGLNGRSGTGPPEPDQLTQVEGSGGHTDLKVDLVQTGAGGVPSAKVMGQVEDDALD